AILRHVDRVDVLDERRSHWSVRAPGGKHVEWDAEITEDRPGEVLAWRSLEGSPVQQLGSLHFDVWRDGGTLLRVDLRLLPPAGAAGTALTALLQPLLEREIHEDLRRFKRSLEAVESVPDPHLINPRDAIVKVTSTAICGSDLHLYDGFIPTMKKGDILGHE